MGRVPDSDAGLQKGDHSPGNRSPQAGDQQDADCRSNTLRHHGRAHRMRRRAAHTTIDERPSGEQPLHQKAATGPTVREAREEALHTVPLSAYERRHEIETFDTGTRHSPFRGIALGLNFDYSPLQGDGDGVRAVVRSQLGEDARDVAFNGFLSNRKLRGDLLVRISRCD